LPRSEHAREPQELNGDESGTPGFDHTMTYCTQGIRLNPLDTSRLAARRFIGLAAIALLAPALATDDPIQPLSGINRRSALTSGGVASAWDEEWPAEIREGARNHAHGWAGGLSRMALSARAVMGDVVD
jgi:hypothetical protein